MTPNTASATIAAAGAPRRARPPRGSPPARSPARSSPACTIRGALVQMGKLKIDRAHWDWDEVGSNPFFCPDAAAAARFADYLDDDPQGGLLGRRGGRDRRRGRSGRLGRADLRQARRGARERADERQRGQGRRDRRRLRRRRTHRRGERRRDARRQRTGGRAFSPTTPAGFSAASRPDSRSSPASPSSRPRRSCRRAARSPAPSRRRRSSPRAATTPASASAPCRSARRWSPACWRTRSCGTGGRSGVVSGRRLVGRNASYARRVARRLMRPRRRFGGASMAGQRHGVTRREVLIGAAGGLALAAVDPPARRMAQGATVSGLVFEDRDGSGVAGPANPGLPGVLVSNGRDVAVTGAGRPLHAAAAGRGDDLRRQAGGLHAAGRSADQPAALLSPPSAERLARLAQPRLRGHRADRAHARLARFRARSVRTSRRRSTSCWSPIRSRRPRPRSISSART